MQELQIKSAKLVSPGLHRIEILESSILQYTHLPGSVFGITYIEGPENNDRKELSRIVHEQLNQFAQAEPGANIPRRFEQLLQQINQEIEAFFANQPKVTEVQLNAVIGTRIKNQLFLSGIGNLHAIFMHRTAKQRYSIYELDKQLREESIKDKPFSTVLDGELHPGDLLYLSTPLDPKDISLGELQDILVTLPASGALKRIEQHVHTDRGFAAICLQIKEPEQSTAPKKVNPLSSIEELSETQSKTDQLLNEQGTDIVQSIQKKLNPLLKNLNSSGRNDATALFKKILKVLVKCCILLIWALKTTAEYCAKIAKSLYASYKKSRTKTESTEPAALNEQPTETNKIQFHKKKFLYPSLLALAGVSIILLIIAFTGNKEGTKFTNNEQVLKHIEEQINAAEASLIYNDQEQAQLFINEAKTALLSIAGKERNQEALDQLQNELDRIEMRAKGITIPENLTELSTIDTAAHGEITAIHMLNNSMHAITSNKTLFSYSELTNTWRDEALTAGSFGTPKQIIPEAQNALALDQNNRIARINFNTSTLTPLTSGTTALSDVQEITIFNTSVYALTNTTKQIIRMRPQGDGFEAGTAWINATNETLEDLRSFAIDGEIYVLSKAKIYKFLSGTQQNFAIQNLTPALSDATKIWTNESSQHLYILEPAEKRIVVLAKNGQVVAQYQHELLKDAIDFNIQEANATIYFTTNKNVYSFTASHIIK